MARTAGRCALSLLLAGIALGFTACSGSSTGISPATPTPAVPAGDPVQFTALVSSVTGACPSITFSAGGTSVTTDFTTTYVAGTCADIKRASLVDIAGRQAAGEAVRAASVRLDSDGPGADGLLSDVAAGGYVLFFRHSERNAGAISTAALAVADNAGECVPGSELTANGTADAIALGERFRRYGIAVQKVYASPTCRTTQMARLAFGEGFETTRALTWAGMWAPDEEAALATPLRQLLGGRPESRKNIVLIAHNDVLRASRVGLDLTLDQAEAAVFRPLGGEAFEYLGKIPKAEWMGK